MILTNLRRAVAVSLGAGTLLAVSAACLSVARADTTNAVSIKNFMFMPMALTVKAGTTVTWTNLDGEPHTVVDDAGLFRSSALDQSDTFKYKFDKRGVYGIFCGIHPNMRETITVN
jgi:plastocyanin